MADIINKYFPNNQIWSIIDILIQPELSFKIQRIISRLKSLSSQIK